MWNEDYKDTEIVCYNCQSVKSTISQKLLLRDQIFILSLFDIDINDDEFDLFKIETAYVKLL